MNARRLPPASLAVGTVRNACHDSIGSEAFAIQQRSLTHALTQPRGRHTTLHQPYDINGATGGSHSEQSTVALIDAPHVLQPCVAFAVTCCHAKHRQSPPRAATHHAVQRMAVDEGGTMVKDIRRSRKRDSFRRPSSRTARESTGAARPYASSIKTRRRLLACRPSVTFS